MSVEPRLHGAAMLCMVTSIRFCCLQRYAQTSVLKRSIFELIAAELIKTMTEQLSAASPEPSRHNGKEIMDAT